MEAKEGGKRAHLSFHCKIKSRTCTKITLHILGILGLAYFEMPSSCHSQPQLLKMETLKWLVFGICSTTCFSLQSCNKRSLSAQYGNMGMCTYKNMAKYKYMLRNIRESLTVMAEGFFNSRPEPHRKHYYVLLE